MNAQFQPDRVPAGVETLRIPPHAIDAEQSVLGGLMIDPPALAKISDWLTEADFYRRDHRLIYQAICALIGRGNPVDPVTMADWFEVNGLAEIVGGTSYLYELHNATPSAANIVAYAEIVVEKSRLRSAIDIGMKLSDGAYSHGSEAQQILSQAQHELSQVQTAKMRGGLEPVKAAMKRMQAELMARYEKGPGLLGQPWPWQELNRCTKGLRDGVLYVVGARPSMGKSIFGLQTAVNAALNGQRAAFFSVEMGAEECMTRAVACVGRIPHDWVENPAQDDPDAELHWAHLTDATSSIIKSPLLIDETPAINIDQLVARARRAHMQNGLRLIVIDHMHDMALDKKAEQRHEYGRIAQGAKTLAKELRCPVILLAQLNRAAANRSDKRPTLTDLRESGEIEQKADVVLFLHREDYYNKDTSMKGVVEVIPGKGRNLRLADTIILENIFSEMRMADWIGPVPIDDKHTHQSHGKGGLR
jgi:replicative DNA helicase